ncbi:MAG: hypothetical protein L6Q35_01375 [Phycisphaerales bacterium]|nr:hypothetical protein [Phycisphaerales bacterium]
MTTTVRAEVIVGVLVSVPASEKSSVPRCTLGLGMRTEYRRHRGLGPRPLAVAPVHRPGCPREMPAACRTAA